MAVNRISPVPIQSKDCPINFPSADGINARVLAANVAEDITIPTGANMVRLAGTVDFYLRAGAAAAVPAADVTDGSASELIKSNSEPEWRAINGVTQISVCAAATCIVTATFYTL